MSTALGIFGVAIAIFMMLLPLAFIGFLIVAIVRRRALWWVLTGVTAALCLLVAVPVVFIAARAWKDGSDRALAMIELQNQGLTEENGTRVECSEGLVALIVPRNWRDVSRQIGNEDGSLAYGNLAREEFCLVITEPREDFLDESGEEGFDLDEYSEVVIQMITAELVDLGISGPHAVPLPGAPLARRAEIRGKYDGLVFAYVLTVIETEGHFHQIVQWTQAENIDEKRPIFYAVAQTFESIAPPMPEP